MPQVPSLTTSRIAHRPDATPFQSAAPIVNAMRTVSAAQQNIGASFANAANTMAAVSEQNQIEENERLASEADIAFTKQRRQIMFGSDDGKTPGFYSLNNRDAVNAAPGVKAEIDALQKSIAEGLVNTEVRAMFDKVSMTRINSETRDMDRFTIKQQHGAKIIASTARRDEAVQDAIGGRHSPGVLIAAAATIRGEVFKQADLEGWDAVTTQRMLQSETTRMYSKVIDSMLKNNEASEARIMLDRVSSDAPGSFQMDPEAAAISEEKVTNGLFLETVQNQAAILRQSGNTLEENLALVREGEYSAEERKGITTLLNQMAAEDSRASAAAMAQIEGNVNQVIAQGGSLVKWMTANPDQAILMIRDSKAMKRVEDYQQLVADGRNHRLTTDGSKASELRMMEPHKLAQINLEGWRGQLTKDEYEKAAGWIKGAKEVMRKEGTDNRTVRHAAAVVRHHGEQIGIEWDAKKKPEHNQRQWSLENQMTAWVLNQETTPTNAEIDQYAQFLTTTGAVQPELWGGDVVLGFVPNPFGTDQREISLSEAMTLKPGDPNYANVTVPYEVIPPSLTKQIEGLFIEEKLKGYTQQDVSNFAGAIVTSNGKRKDEIVGRIKRAGTPAPVPRKKQAEAEAQLALDLAEYLGRPKEMVKETTTTPRAEPRPSATIELANLPSANETDFDAKFEANTKFFESTEKDAEGGFTAFPDPVKGRLVGWGFQLDRDDAKKKIEDLGLDFDKVYSGEQSMTEEQAQTLFDITQKETEADAKKLFSNWEGISDNRKLALMDMIYSVGYGKWSKYKDTIAAVEAEDWDKVVKQFPKGGNLHTQQGDRRWKPLMAMLKEG